MNLRTWLAVALLSVAWLPGLGYYSPARPVLWTVLVVAATALLLGGVYFKLPKPHESRLALLLMLPVAWFMPWPYQGSALLLTVGLAAIALPIPRRWPPRLATACIAAGSVLLAQSAAVYVYLTVTARSHDLPAPLAFLIGLLARLIGIDAGSSASTLAARPTTVTQSLGATWDLVLPPALVCFAVGAAVIVALSLSGRTHRWRSWAKKFGLVLLVIALWLPFRLAVVLGLYCNRVALADPSVPLCVMNQFLVTWFPALLLAVPVLLCWWFFATRESSDPSSTDVPPTGRKLLTAIVLAAVGAALLAFPWAWNPVGTPKQGRIRFVERASKWEPSDAPYDERSYGEPASYTYRLIYDYLSHFFTMSRIDRQTPISDESLKDCDVLVLKTPTSRMSRDEVAAIVRFVEHGGGLLMIGDHTNVFKSSTFLNDVARPLGFTYRNDLLFRVDTPYEQPYEAATIVHPAVQHIGDLDFAVSCSIDPGTSWGRAALGGLGLWNIQAEYQNSNYHPPAEYRPEMRTGPFVQLWAARHGKGRVLAFTDSTIFSNFCTFQPGKSELMLNMLAWLNHTSPFDQRYSWLMVVLPVVLIGLVLLGAGIAIGRKVRGGWLLVVASGLFGTVACCLILTSWAAVAMPMPAVQAKPFEVVIDRTVSKVPLSEGAYIQGDGHGYGLFEQWIPRLNGAPDPSNPSKRSRLFTSRRQGESAFTGDMLVVICPTGSVTEDYRKRLIDYVRGGGRLVVLDAPTNTHSTANRLLWPFGLSMQPPLQQGELQILGRSTGIDIDGDHYGWSVEGGTPIATIAKRPSSSVQPGLSGASRLPVAAETTFGSGIVTAVGFASAIDDDAMGREWLLEPDEALLRRYDMIFTLLRYLAKDRPPQTN